jgi:hypothetical protein
MRSERSGAPANERLAGKRRGNIPRIWGKRKRSQALTALGPVGSHTPETQHCNSPARSTGTRPKRFTGSLHPSRFRKQARRFDGLQTKRVNGVCLQECHRFLDGIRKQDQLSIGTVDGAQLQHVLDVGC